jgi:hypothetical protein
MEFLTGLLPTAAAFLFPLGYQAAASTSVPHNNYTLRDRWSYALGGIFAFSLGVVLTSLIKQLLAMSVFGWQVIDAFFGNLVYYMATPETGASNRLLAGVDTTILSIRKFGKILTYGNVTASKLLFVGSTFAWLGALLIAMRARSLADLSSFASCAIGASLVFLWILLLPTHTGHPYMIRIMIAPLALGWVALALQIKRLKHG